MTGATQKGLQSVDLSGQLSNLFEGLDELIDVP